MKWRNLSFHTIFRPIALQTKKQKKPKKIKIYRNSPLNTHNTYTQTSARSKAKRATKRAPKHTNHCQTNGQNNLSPISKTHTSLSLLPARPALLQVRVTSRVLQGTGFLLLLLFRMRASTGGWGVVVVVVVGGRDKFKTHSLFLDLE